MGRIGVIQDITERKAAEEALREARHELERRVEQRTAELQAAKEEAELANRAKTSFLAAASHDLRQPLQALNMFVNVLSSRDHDKKTREVIGKIERSMKSLEELLNALLDISRLEAGIVVPEVIDFPIGGLLWRLGDEFRPLAADNGLELRMATSSMAIHSDPMLLEEIIRNLLANAVRYTKRGRILLGCRRRGANLRIEVWDTGVGIADDQLKLIFQEFHQIENKGFDRRRERGLGLGLAIVNRLAGLLEHRIDVSSAPGKGSVFAVEAFIGDAPSTMPEPGKSLPRPDVDGAFIVVIENDGDVLEGMRMQFDEWGCNVLAAGSCQEALESLDKRGRLPDLVVADFRLAKRQSGIEAINTIKRKLKAEIPGILVTGDTAPERLREAKKSGFTLLHKPARPDKLRRALAETLGEGMEKTWQPENEPRRD